MNKLAKCGLYMQWNTGLFPGATSGKEPACQGDVRDTGLILGPGRFFGVGNSKPLQYSCLENPTDRGARQATVHGVPRVGHY